MPSFHCACGTSLPQGTKFCGECGTSRIDDQVAFAADEVQLELDGSIIESEPFICLVIHECFF